eukprot:GHVR01162776.1.p1 GENE.GHVR01162776.1~~GHVR01162776.1.p1  ORF type:complete len:117 (+),score=15.38 GHVR01162776.1:327-677(+)
MKRLLIVLLGLGCAVQAEEPGWGKQVGNTMQLDGPMEERPHIITDSTCGVHHQCPEGQYYRHDVANCVPLPPKALELIEALERRIEILECRHSRDDMPDYGFVDELDCTPEAPDDI